MKKMITLLIVAGSFVAVQAQTSKDEARKVVLGGSKNGGTSSKRGRDVVLGGNNGTTDRTYPNPNNYPNGGSRQAQADQVNREYDAKINSIRNNVYLSQSEKERMIAQLQKDRARRLREINNNSYSKGRKYGHDNEEDDEDDDHHEGRHDNGKHKGWEKGKGNQGKHKHED